MSAQLFNCLQSLLYELCINGLAESILCDAGKTGLVIFCCCFFRGPSKLFAIYFALLRKFLFRLRIEHRLYILVYYSSHLLHL